jgi:hypothetical protein
VNIHQTLPQSPFSREKESLAPDEAEQRRRRRERMHIERLRELKESAEAVQGSESFRSALETHAHGPKPWVWT